MLLEWEQSHSLHRDLKCHTGSQLILGTDIPFLLSIFVLKDTQDISVGRLLYKSFVTKDGRGVATITYGKEKNSVNSIIKFPKEIAIYFLIHRNIVCVLRQQVWNKSIKGLLQVHIFFSCNVKIIKSLHKLHYHYRKETLEVFFQYWLLKFSVTRKRTLIWFPSNCTSSVYVASFPNHLHGNHRKLKIYHSQLSFLFFQLFFIKFKGLF